MLVWSRTLDNARSLAEKAGGAPEGDIQTAVRSADIVSCATPATSPILPASVLEPGTHINAIGAFPDMAGGVRVFSSALA